MDPNYAMAKFRMESKDILRSKQKGCWYYLKYFFFFLSIIQFLIILGLVLFMLYGNAHVGTEVRLKSVESRYQNLTADYNRLNDRLTLEKTKLAAEEKQKKNCTDMLFKCKNVTKVPVCPPNIDACRPIKYLLDQLNMTCTREKFFLLKDKLQTERDFAVFKNTCSQTNSLLTKQAQEASSEKEKIQKEKTDLESQLLQLQSGCTSINEKFDLELEHLRKTFDRTINSLNPSDTYQTQRCRTIPDSIKNNIDLAINRLRQDVTSVMLEISQVKVSNARINDDLQKCNQDKDTTNREKIKFISEKELLEKQLAEKINQVNTYFSQYLKKDEELENCRKPRLPGQRM